MNILFSTPGQWHAYFLYILPKQPVPVGAVGGLSDFEIKPAIAVFRNLREKKSGKPYLRLFNIDFPRY